MAMSAGNANHRKMEWLDPARVARVMDVVAINAGRMRDEAYRRPGER